MPKNRQNIADKKWLPVVFSTTDISQKCLICFFSSFFWKYFNNIIRMDTVPTPQNLFLSVTFQGLSVGTNF